MKKITKTELAELFAANPAYTTLFFTADGEVFLTENYALQYARTEKLADQTITPVEKESELVESDEVAGEEKKVSAAELITLITALKTVEEYHAFELPEGEKRATVVKALADKKTELEIA